MHTNTPVVLCTGALSFNTIFDLVDQQGRTMGQAIKVRSGQQGPLCACTRIPFRQPSAVWRTPPSSPARDA